MNDELVRVDSDATQKRTWSAAEAAAHPALGLRPAGSKPLKALSRVPKASVAPSSSETMITPAPKFDDSGERIDAAPEAAMNLVDDDLDGIVELSSTMLEDESESLAHEIEVLADDLIEEVTDDVVELHDDEVIEEVDSGMLAYGETRGVIDEVPRRVPAPTDVSKVSVVSLRGSLHNQVVENGMLTYGTGVPIHDLEHVGSASQTLQIRRPSTAGRNSRIKNVVMASVFFAGIGFGVYFGLPSNNAAPAAAPQAANAIQAPEMAASAQQMSAPVVAPLERTAAIVAPDEALAAPLPEVNYQEEPTGGLPQATDALDIQAPHVAPLAPVQAQSEETTIDVRPLEVKSKTQKTNADLPKAQAPRKQIPSRQAHSGGAKDSAISGLGKSGNGDPGVLMLGAKPPCDIFIDGKKTGLKTPQRVLRLPPGKHKITLMNQEHRIRESFRVSIQSGQKTRVMRDMTSRIR
ncbi:MAG: hypothetical protein GY811_04840 [Myxococcales bacterium]|nr:hypothetical protein [Myxococcales bacterium]